MMQEIVKGKVNDNNETRRRESNKAIVMIEVERGSF
jgi:hypothetical protein